MQTANWVIMVVRTGRAMTEAAIRSIQAQTVPVNLLVVVNGVPGNDAALYCMAGPGDYSRSWSTTVYYDQRSLAYCWNRAIDWVFGQPGVERVLVVNNDVELRPETYELLADSDYLFITGVGEANKKKALSAPLDTSGTPHNTPDFSCFMIDHYAWDRIGGFDENAQGAYIEDCLFHLKMHRNGVRAVSIQLPFYHIGSGTIKSLPREAREKIQQQAEKNREYFTRLYGCLPGTAEYQLLFDESTFGVDAGKQ